MFLKNKKDLNLKFLKKKKPDIIFFPHWNYLIKKNMGDLMKQFDFTIDDKYLEALEKRIRTAKSY